MKDARFEIELAKQDFKFSAGHFTLFPDGSAESLHGHDYRVRVRVAAGALPSSGLLADVAELKESIRKVCAELDERVLVPARASDLDVRSVPGGEVEIHLNQRRWVLPADEVTMLDVPNISMEALAGWLWERLAASLRPGPVEELCVEVEETPGQSARCTAPLPTP